MAKPDVNTNQQSPDPNKKPDFLETLYKSTLGQTAGDYDSIMDQYKDFKPSNTPSPMLSFSPVTPSLAGYTRSKEFGNASSLFGDLAKTGGYSEGDINNIRERGISPLRSVYGNAQQNLSRQRSLQGGYSPSYNATSSKLTRELADLVSSKTTDVNAQIAEMVQSGKLAGATGMGNLGINSNSLVNQINQANANATNQANQLNATLPLSYGQYNKSINDESNANNNSAKLASISGQQSLYGTTPALANTFGQQVMELLRQQQQNNSTQSMGIPDTRLGVPQNRFSLNPTGRLNPNIGSNPISQLPSQIYR